MLDAIGFNSPTARDDAAQAAAEARRRAEEAARRAAEEARRRAEEARRRAEEARQRAEAARRAAAEAEARAEQSRLQQDKDKAAQARADYRARQEEALRTEAQAVLKDKEHGLAQARLKDAQDGRPPTAPSTATKDAQAQVDKARATAAFYEPATAAQANGPFVNGKGPVLAKPPLLSQTPLFNLGPKHDVDSYARQIREVYDQSGAAAAARQLALAEGDAGLSPAQRKQLLARAQPVVDKIAETVGQDARRTDLPADGKAGKTSGIDDKAEYRAVVDDLAAAADAAGDATQARHIAQRLLGHLPAAASPGGGADKLDLLGEALSGHATGQGSLREAVLFALQSPQHPRPGSVLAAPADVRTFLAGLLAGVQEPADVATASPAQLVAMKAYTDGQVDLSQDLLQAARKKEEALGRHKPGTKDYEMAAAAYRSAANLAIRERSKTEQAIAAELRQTYRGDPANTVATEDAAHEIAKRFRKDPEAQLSVRNALATVKTETALQRDTGNKLYEFHRAADEVTRLQAQYNETGQTDGSAYKQALADYAAKRDAVMSALGHELESAEAGAPDAGARDKAIDEGEMKIVDRYLGDEDLARLAAAASIVRYTERPSGTTDQMLALGKAMPADTSPQIRELVMSHSTVKKLFDSYVNESAEAVTAAYDKGVRDYRDKYGDATLRDKSYVPPATAATRKLVELTDPARHPELTPKITARIMNKLFSAENGGTLDKVIDDVSRRGDHSAELLTVEGAHKADFKPLRGLDQDELVAYDMKDFQEIMNGLVNVVDRAAAGSHPAGKGQDGKPAMAWESSEVQEAVESAGRSMALNVDWPGHARYGQHNRGFERAAAEGHGVTLALEVARQERLLQTDNGLQPLGRHERDLAKETLQSVGNGLEQLKADSRKLFEDEHKRMAALEVPQLRFGKLMTQEQQQQALQAVIDKQPGLAADFQKGKSALDARGYQLLRIGEMVTFYGHEDRLGRQDGFNECDGKRNTLLDDDYVKTMVLGSDAASTRIKEQAVHSSLNWMRDAGTVPPAALGPIPVNLYLQWTGDFTENMVENNHLKKIHGESRARLGNHGPLAAASWGAVGATQLWFAEYLYHNVNFDASQSWRKPLLLGLVGGFGAVKLLQAGAALTHKGAQALPASVQKILDDSKSLPSVKTLEKATEFTRTAEWRSIGFFGLLHADAAVWDASRMYSEYKNWEDGKPVDQRTFWTATVNLSNDVAISTVEFQSAWKLLKDPLVTTDEAKRIAAQGGAAITRDGPVKGAQVAIERTLMGNAFSRFGLKAVMAPFNFYELIGKQLAKKLPFMGANPAGWVATAAWTATDLINWIGNHAKVQKQLESVDQDFLTGAGMTSAAAETLGDRSLLKANFVRWLHGDSLADGLLDAYDAAGGDPDKFVDWVNALQGSGQLEQVRRAADHETDKRAPANWEAFLALPEDPAKVDLSYSSVAYNGVKKRFEDPMTQTYFANGLWFYDKDIDAAAGAVKVDDPRKGHLFHAYYPESGEIRFSDIHSMPIDLSARNGRALQNWLKAHGIAPPPTPKPADVASAPAVDTSQTRSLNTHKVQENESVWGIAGNDPEVVRWIYDHNSWLNDRIEADQRPINARGEQNPNYIEVGDVLVLPEGYRVPRP